MGIPLINFYPHITMTTEPIVSHQYKVIVADNFHYMDRDYRKEGGSFPTLESAIATCKQMTVHSVMLQYEEGIEPSKLVEKYKAFGLDPYIISPDSDSDVETIPFSAWTFVSEELCAQIIQDMKNSCLAKRESRTVLLTAEDGSPEECVEELLKRWSK